MVGTYITSHMHQSAQIGSLSPATAKSGCYAHGAGHIPLNIRILMCGVRGGGLATDAKLGTGWPEQYHEDGSLLRVSGTGRLQERSAHACLDHS